MNFPSYKKYLVLAAAIVIVLGGVDSLRAQAAIESSIVSEFDGLSHGNVYKLANGQIWKQTEVYIWVRIWIGPKVIIYQEGVLTKMKVEGIAHAVTVERIK